MSYVPLNVDDSVWWGNAPQKKIQTDGTPIYVYPIGWYTPKITDPATYDPSNYLKAPKFIDESPLAISGHEIRGSGESFAYDDAGGIYPEYAVSYGPSGAHQDKALAQVNYGWKIPEYVDLIRSLVEVSDAGQQYDSQKRRVMNDYLRRGYDSSTASKIADRALSPVIREYRMGLDALFGDGGIQKIIDSSGIPRSLNSFNGRDIAVLTNNAAYDYQVDSLANNINQRVNDFQAKYSGGALADMLASAALKYAMTPKELTALRAQRGAGTPIPAAPGQQYSTVFPQAQTSSSYAGRIKENV